MNQITRIRRSTDNRNMRAVKAAQRLVKVVEEQRAAVQDYRKSIEGLSSAIDELKASVETYHRSVKRIDVEPLRRKAQRLARIMDDSSRPAETARAA